MWEPNSAKVVGPRPPGESFPDYSKIYDLSKRRLHRGVHDGRWKFARYFAPAHHHTPKDWKTLAACNDLELYDTHADPRELVNLANDPKHRKTVMRLNSMVNALSEREIGKGLDDGREYPGPREMYTQPGGCSLGPTRILRKILTPSREIAFLVLMTAAAFLRGLPNGDL